MGDRVDEFESLFKSADKPAFAWKETTINKAVLVTDQGPEDSAVLLKTVQKFTSPLNRHGEPVWSILSNDDYGIVQNLLERLDALKPDLVVTNRDLKDCDSRPIHSLGVYVDMLTQATDYIVLLLPDLDRDDFDKRMKHARQVMLVTDHLAGDSRLVNLGTRFLQEEGNLFFTHVENDRVFEHYINVIGKIPEINTEVARETIRTKLLQEPQDFIDRCIVGLLEHGANVKPHSIVRLGHRILDYMQLVREHDVNLLILHTKDEEQLAMQGKAYSIAVEFVHIPLLLI